jgi:antitoxin PrlF
MAVTPYRVTPARIGNSSGLRLEPEDPQQGEAEEDSLLLGLFLDFLSRQALSSDQGPVLYTEAMAADDDELLAGVTVEAANEPLGA